VKRLDALCNTKGWRERLKLARNEEPGTPFDHLFAAADSFFQLMDVSGGWGKGEAIPITKLEGAPILASIGVDFVNLFQERDGGQKLHEMADALNAWHRHKETVKHNSQSIPDVIRVTLISLYGMFPPGKPRLEIVGNKIVKRKAWPNLTVRSVIASLEKRDKITAKDANGNALPEIRREIQRQAKILNIPLDPTPGRPPKSKTRQKP
jgi:hypothetical protein